MKYKVIIVIFVVLESACQIFWAIKWPPNDSWRVVKEGGNYMRPGPQTIFTGNVNSYGYRGEEWNIIKMPSKTRIVCLGDSIFTGCESTTSIPDELQALLGNKYEVFNGGLLLNTSSQALYRLRNDFLKLNPDIVIVQIGINDIGEYSRLITFLRYSKLFRAITYPIELHRPLDNIERFRLNLKLMANTCKSNNIRMILTTISTRDDLDGSYSSGIFYWYNEAIRSVALSKHMEFVNIKLNKDDFGLWLHLNDKGNREFAQQVYQKIKSM